MRILKKNSSITTLVFLIFLPLLSSCQLESKTSCSVGYGEYGPLQFILNKDKVRPELKLKQKKISKNKVQENLIFEDESKLNISQSGCSHHTVEFSFSGHQNLKSGHQLEQAVLFLKKIKHISGQEVESLIDVLNQLNSEDIDYDNFSCAESQCSIIREKEFFKIIQDFPV